MTILTIRLTIETAPHIYKGITKVVELFTWNTQEMCLLPAFTSERTVLFPFLWKRYFPHFYSCDLLLRDTWIRIPYSAIRRNQSADCFLYADNPLLRQQRSLNFLINRARQYSCYREAMQCLSIEMTFELQRWHFTPRRRGRECFETKARRAGIFP